MSLAARVRGWARGHTHARRYSPVGQLFHWTMAALVTFQLWWGWRIGRLPVGAEKLEGYQVHSQIGLVLLLLILMRAAWRLWIPGPVNDADKPGWQSTAAHLTHYAFYAILVGLPLTGWAMWSSVAAEQPLQVAGLLPWPHLPLDGLPRATRWTIMSVAETLHGGLIVLLLILIPMHVGAALKHHFLDRDDVLAAMTPVLEPLPPADPEAPPAAPQRSETPQVSPAHQARG